MLFTEFLILFTLGVAIGTFGTLIGAGGGFLTVPLLIIAYNFEPALAVGTSLVLVFFNSVSGSLAYLRQRRVDIRVGSIFTVLTIPGAIVGAFITSYFESNIFNLFFVAILITSSIYMLLNPVKEMNIRRKSGSYKRRLKDFCGEVYEYSVHLPRGFLISFLVGFISSIFGIGGGIIHVPAMIFLLGIPVHISTATSHFILAFSSFFGTATHFTLGNINLEFAISMGIGALLGAQLGAIISKRTKATIIQRFLGIALIIVAIRMLI